MYQPEQYEPALPTTQPNSLPVWASIALRLSLIGGLAAVATGCSRPVAFCEVGGPEKVAQAELRDYLHRVPEATIPPCAATFQEILSRQQQAGKTTFLLPQSMNIVRN